MYSVSEIQSLTMHQPGDPPNMEQCAVFWAVFRRALLVELLDRYTFCGGWMSLPVTSAFLSRAEGRSGQAWVGTPVEICAQSSVPVSTLCACP